MKSLLLHLLPLAIATGLHAGPLASTLRDIVAGDTGADISHLQTALADVPSTPATTEALSICQAIAAVRAESALAKRKASAPPVATSLSAPGSSSGSDDYWRRTAEDQWAKRREAYRLQLLGRIERLAVLEQNHPLPPDFATSLGRTISQAAESFPIHIRISQVLGDGVIGHPLRPVAVTSRLGSVGGGDRTASHMVPSDQPVHIRCSTAGLVDGDDIALTVIPAGTYRYTTVLGAPATIRAYRAIGQ